MNLLTRFWRKSAKSRADEDAADERGDSTDGVNISATGVIAVPNCWRKFERFWRVQKPAIRPGPVNSDWLDESRRDYSVNDIRSEKNINNMRIIMGEKT